MYRRHLEHKLRESLADTRVVMIAGPRQSGKTTLARQLTDNTRTYVTLSAGYSHIGVLAMTDRSIGAGKAQ